MRLSKPSWVVRWLSTAVAVVVAAVVLPGIEINGGIFQVLLLAIVLGAINTIIRPVVIFLSLPLIVITLGGFLLVINALTLSWAASITGVLTIHGFGWTFLGALVITVVSWLIQRRFTPKPRGQNFVVDTTLH